MDDGTSQPGKAFAISFLVVEIASLPFLVGWLDGSLWPAVFLLLLPVLGTVLAVGAASRGYSQELAASYAGSLAGTLVFATVGFIAHGDARDTVNLLFFVALGFLGVPYLVVGAVGAATRRGR